MRNEKKNEKKMKIVMTFDLKMTKQEFDDSFNSWRNTFEMESNTPMTGTISWK
jgi:hypothetical protein